MSRTMHIVAALLSTVVVLGMAGLAGAQTEPAAPAADPAAAAAAPAPTPAAAPTGSPVTEAALVGNWSADFPAMLAAQQMTDDERAQAQQMLAGASAVMTFNADHTAAYHATVMGQVQDKTGTWALDPAASTLTMTDPDGSVDVLSVSTPDANTLLVGTPGGDQMIWRRAQ